MASETEKGLPDWYALGIKDGGAEIDFSAAQNIKWAAGLGSKTFGSPVVSQGRVFIGTMGASSADAALLCLDEETGESWGDLSAVVCHAEVKNMGYARHRPSKASASIS